MTEGLNSSIGIVRKENYVKHEVINIWVVNSGIVVAPLTHNSNIKIKGSNLTKGIKIEKRMRKIKE
jgi:hypothetical protein